MVWQARLMTDMCTSTHPHAHQQAPRFTAGAHCDHHPSDNHVRPTHKPLKRRAALSKHYGGKSQSFSSLELALSTQYGESALGLAKRPSSQDLVQVALCTYASHGVGAASADLADACAGSTAYFSSLSTGGHESAACLPQHVRLPRQGAQYGGSARLAYPEPPPSVLQGALSEPRHIPTSTSHAHYHHQLHHSLTATPSSSCLLQPSRSASSACAPSSCPPTDMRLSEALVPGWLHCSTEELCMALRRSSLLRDGASSGGAGTPPPLLSHACSGPAASGGPPGSPFVDGAGSLAVTTHSFTYGSYSHASSSGGLGSGSLHDGGLGGPYGALAVNQLLTVGEGIEPC